MRSLKPDNIRIQNACHADICAIGHRQDDIFESLGINGNTGKVWIDNPDRLVPAVLPAVIKKVYGEGRALAEMDRIALRVQPMRADVRQVIEQLKRVQHAVTAKLDALYDAIQDGSVTRAEYDALKAIQHEEHELERQLLCAVQGAVGVVATDGGM